MMAIAVDQPERTLMDTVSQHTYQEDIDNACRVERSGIKRGVISNMTMTAIKKTLICRNCNHMVVTWNMRIGRAKVPQCKLCGGYLD